MFFSKILIPTKLQTDTAVAIFLLKQFGENIFQGISSAHIEISALLPKDESASSLSDEGVLCVDVGNGIFDHHGLENKVTSSSLIAEYLNIKNNIALGKLLMLAERDDVFGKGVVSKDPIDKAFGIPNIIMNLNKVFENNQDEVYKNLQPIFFSHYQEEKKRLYELPKIFDEKLKDGKSKIFELTQRGKKIRVVMIDSDDQSISGYLRSRNGGNFDVVVLRLASGHCNIITRAFPRTDLQSLTVVLRKSEAMVQKKELSDDMTYLSSQGRINEVPEWYFDPNTNSILNGGINPQDVMPTKIPKDNLEELIKIGLTEKLWSPRINENKGYIAVVLDEESSGALKKIAIHPKIYAHHMTVTYHPTDEEVKRYEKRFGEKVTLNVLGMASDNNGQAVLVDGFDTQNKFSHITISCNNVPPVYSNELLEKTKIKPIEIKKITGTLKFVSE